MASAFFGDLLIFFASPKVTHNHLKSSELFQKTTWHFCLSVPRIVQIRREAARLSVWAESPGLPILQAESE